MKLLMLAMGLAYLPGVAYSSGVAVGVGYFPNVKANVVNTEHNQKKFHFKGAQAKVHVFTPIQYHHFKVGASVSALQLLNTYREPRDPAVDPTVDVTGLAEGTETINAGSAGLTLVVTGGNLRLQLVVGGTAGIVTQTGDTPKTQKVSGLMGALDIAIAPLKGASGLVGGLEISYYDFLRGQDSEDPDNNYGFQFLGISPYIAFMIGV